MPIENEMSVSERRKYLKRMYVRYVGAKRAERGQLLTEMEQVTGLHRKSLTRLMHIGSLERKKRVIPTCVPNDRIRRIKTRREKETDDGNASDTSGTSFTRGRGQRADETGGALLGAPALVDHL